MFSHKSHKKQTKQNRIHKESSHSYKETKQNKNTQCVLSLFQWQIHLDMIHQHLAQSKHFNKTKQKLCNL